MKLIVATGGTGGHIFPAMVVAIEAKKAGLDVVFVYGGSKIPEEKFVPALIDADVRPVRISAGRDPLKVVRGMIEAGTIMPEITCGTRTAVLAAGSYAVAPVLAVALLSGVPIYLLEQNMLPGRVVRFFARFARCVFSEFPLNRRKFTHSGNPIRPIKRMDKLIARKQLGIPTDRFTILVMGGSLASLRLASTAVEAAKLLPETFWLIQTGGKIKAEPPNAMLIDFISDVGLFYSAADILFARAGGGTIAEAALFGLPMILVPYPHASENHQVFNAKYIEQLGGGIWFLETELTPQKVASVIRELMREPTRIRQMSASIKRFARPEAAQFVTSMVLSGARCA